MLTDHLFTWPKRQTARADAWTRFVRSKRRGKNGEEWSPNSGSKWWVLRKYGKCLRLHPIGCTVHWRQQISVFYFTEHQYCFVMFRFTLHYFYRLKLNDSAVPSVQLEPGDWQTIPSPRKQQDSEPMCVRERRTVIRDVVSEQWVKTS